MRPRKTDGTLEEQFSDDLFISTVIELGRATPADVAGIIHCNQTVATRRLKDLLRSDRLTGVKIAGRWIFEVKH